MDRKINQHVNHLYNMHVKEHINDKGELKKGETVSRKIGTAVANDFNEKYKMDNKKLDADGKLQLENYEAGLNDLEKKVYQSNLQDVDEVAWIKFRPGNPGVTVDTFDIKKAIKGKVIHKINCRWIASWLSVVYYRLARRLPDVWLHLPAGNARELSDVAPTGILTSIPTQFPQGVEDLCLIKSLASALYYMGLVQEAGRLNARARAYKNIPLDVAMSNLRKDMQQIAPQIGIGVGLKLPRKMRRSTKNRGKQFTLDNLIHCFTPYPTVVVPLAGDQGSVMLFVSSTL